MDFNKLCTKKVGANALILLMPIAYVFYISFHLPFMTIDELTSVAYGYFFQFQAIIDTGRISHHIALLINQVIGFNVPNFDGKFKRGFILFIFLLVLYLYFLHVKYDSKRSAIIIFVIFLGHQLDWQHNALISFYGGYPLYLSCFLMSIILFEINKGFFVSFVVSGVFLLLSFASEFFVGLAFVYFLTTLRLDRKIKISPHIFLFFVYLFVYIFMQKFTNIEKEASMAEYTFGSMMFFSVVDILNSWGLYLYYSFPYLDLTKFRPNGLFILFFFMLSIIAIFISNIMINGYESFSKKHNLMWAAIFFVPQFLISLQPIKVKWILEGASTHYAFSFYSWLSICIIILPLIKRKFLYVAFIIFIPIAFIILSKNLEFISNYKESIKKWELVQAEANVAISNGEDSIRIPYDYINHPYISGMSPEILSKLVFKEYNLKTYLCKKNDVYDFSKINGLELNGFHDVEASGRWINGVDASVRLPVNLNESDRVILFFSNYLDDNNIKPLTLSVSGNTEVAQLDKDLKVIYQVEESAENPTLTITAASSIRPNDIGIGSDTRDLSLMLRSIEIWRNVDGTYKLNDSSSCKLVDH